MLDWILSRAVHSALNDELKEYGIGSVTEAHVHWKTREVHLHLELEGESIPIELTASQLVFLQVGDDVFVTVDEVKCSRIWIEKVAMKLLPDLRAKLPGKAAKALKLAGVVKPPLVGTPPDTTIKGV